MSFHFISISRDVTCNFNHVLLYLIKKKWRHIRPSLVTHTRNLCSAFNPSKMHTLSSEHTHTHTHTHTLSLSLSLSHTHTLSSEHTHTLSQTYTHTHTLSSEHTHTHPEQGAAIYAVAPGEQLGGRCLAQGHSVVVTGVERALYIHSPPPRQSLPAWDSNSQPFELRVRLSNHQATTSPFIVIYENVWPKAMQSVTKRHIPGTERSSEININSLS